jgi:hypothetical protein
MIMIMMMMMMMTTTLNAYFAAIYFLKTLVGSRGSNAHSLCDWAGNSENADFICVMGPND